MIKGYALKASVLRVGTFFFPGWEARADGEKTGLRPDSQTGLMLVDVPEGCNRITLEFKASLIRLLTGVVSLLTLGVVFAWLLLQFIKH